MSGKYDPPDKARLLADNPRIESIVELAVASAEAQFPPKVKADSDASRARSAEDPKLLAHAQARAMDHPNLKRGRKPVVTSERVQTICDLLAHGETEQSACLRAGIGLTAWSVAKRSDSSLRERIASARDEWARLRHQQRAAALYESQWMRAAGRKALKPQPTHQAKLVAWHLMFRVPLHFAAIPEMEIVTACERFGMSLEAWRRQERAFYLLKKVYAKRAKIRGEQQPAPMNWIQPAQQAWEPEGDY
jgi:hypothetical protein